MFYLLFKSQAWLELLISLPLPPECWYYRCAPQLPAGALCTLTTLMLLNSVILADLLHWCGKRKEVTFLKDSNLPRLTPLFYNSFVFLKLAAMEIFFEISKVTSGSFKIL